MALMEEHREKLGPYYLMEGLLPTLEKYLINLGMYW